MKTGLSVWMGLLLLLLQCCSSAPLYAAADSPPAPTTQQWQQLTTDKAFGYKTEKEVQPEEAANNEALIKAIGLILAFFSSGIGRIIIWVLLFLFAAWALYKIFFSDKTFAWAKKAQKHGNEAMNDIPEDLAHTDWNIQLQKAITANETRLAIRYSYMLLLQQMQEKGQIQYRPDKTNYEYYNELDTIYKQDFRQLTRQYEYAWYGNFEVLPDSYRKYMDTFNHLKRTL